MAVIRPTLSGGGYPYVSDGGIIVGGGARSILGDQDDLTYVRVQYEYPDYQNDGTWAFLPPTAAGVVNSVGVRLHADPTNIFFGAPSVSLGLAAWDSTHTSPVHTWAATSAQYITTTPTDYVVAVPSGSSADPDLLAALAAGDLAISVAHYTTYGPILAGYSFFYDVYEVWANVTPPTTGIPPLLRWPGGSQTGPSRQWPRRLTRRPGTY